MAVDLEFERGMDGPMRVEGVFQFAEMGRRCGYWNDGQHIVSAGACRCGRRFVLVELTAGAGAESVTVNQLQAIAASDCDCPGVHLPAGV